MTSSLERLSCHMVFSCISSIFLFWDLFLKIQKNNFQAVKLVLSFPQPSKLTVIVIFQIWKRILL